MVSVCMGTKAAFKSGGSQQSGEEVNETVAIVFES